MKELTSIASNLLLIPLANGGVAASAELILLSSEPEYAASGNELTRSRPVDQVRVLVTLQSVGGLVTSLLKLGEELEKVESEYNAKLVKPANEPPVG